MEHLFKSVLSVREFKFNTDDDYVDRLSRLYTVMVVVMFAVLVTTKQFVGSPINCWCPAQFTDSHVDYANALCWVSNTYYLPMDRAIPGDEYALGRKICYYQWVPMLLLFQGILSFMPCQLWRFLSQRSGVNLGSIMDAAHATSDSAFLEVREKAMRFVINQIDHYLLAQREYRTGCFIRMKQFASKACCLVGGRDYGNYLTTCYIVIKLLYLASAISQIYLVAAFVGDDYRLYGPRVINRLLRGSNWEELEHFPRVTLCEFAIRDQSRVHNYVVQCTLSINLFNEKIFIFLWFWMVGLAGLTIVDILVWLFRSVYWSGQVQFVRKRLRAFDTSQREAVVMAKFVENYLRRDGMFILRLIGLNVGDVAAGEILAGLWNNYSPERRMLAEKPNQKRTSKIFLNGSSRDSRVDV